MVNGCKCISLFDGVAPGEAWKQAFIGYSEQSKFNLLGCSSMCLAKKSKGIFLFFKKKPGKEKESGGEYFFLCI